MQFSAPPPAGAHQDRLLPMRKFLALFIFFGLSLCVMTAHAQTAYSVKGRVVNESGQPVPKATVAVKGAKTAANHTPITNTRTITPQLYLQPIPQGQIDAMQMSDADKKAYQNPGY